MEVGLRRRHTRAGRIKADLIRAVVVARGGPGRMVNKCTRHVETYIRFDECSEWQAGLGMINDTEQPGKARKWSSKQAKSGGEKKVEGLARARRAKHDGSAMATAE